MRLEYRRTATVLTLAAIPVIAVAAVRMAEAGQQRESAEAEKLIDDLADESFDVRREAREKLLKMGKAAVPALTATALDRNQETGYSAVRILTRMMRERPGEDSKAAEEALKKLAGGKDAIARQAREAVEEAERRPPNRGVRGPVQGFGPGIQQGGGFSRQTSIVNGVETTVVRDNGQTIEIRREPDGPIAVTLTINGEKPKTWKADSADELKKKHPDGWKLVERYAGRGRNLIPNMPNVPQIIGPRGLMDDMFGPGFDPFDPNADPFGRRRRRGRAPQVEQEIKDARMLMQDMSELLKSLKKKTKAPEVERLEGKLDALRRSVERMQRQIGQ